MHKMGCGWGFLLSASKGAPQSSRAKAPSGPESDHAGSFLPLEPPGRSAFSLPSCPWRGRAQGPFHGHVFFIYLADTDLIMSLTHVRLFILTKSYDVGTIIIPMYREEN